jgi:hypothetical protein
MISVIDKGAATTAYRTRSRPTNEAQFNEAFAMALMTNRLCKYGKKLVV